MTWQKVRFDIPENLKPDERISIGQDIVDKIIDNATNGIGVRKSGERFVRKEFAAYSKAYEDKKGQSNVDLTLSGEMLSSLQVLSHKKGSVLVGFENGTEANAKAEGNILGSYGREPNKRKARNFLGLVSSEVRAILKEYKK